MNRRLKVLEVLEATVGGTRRHLMDLVTHLDPERFEVAVACSTLRDPSFEDDVRGLEARGVRVYRIPMRRAIRPIGDAIACLRLHRLMRRGGYDVVHTHSSKAGFIGRLAAWAAEIPWVVHTPHAFAFEMDVSPLARACYFRLERLAAKWADRLICVCPSQQPLAAALGGAERVVVIENGIECPPRAGATARGRQEFGFGAEHLVTGVIGRFAPQKGLVYFVEAARQVAARRPEARFLLVGDGELRPNIEAQIGATGLKDRFVITGRRADVPDIMLSLDLVVFPSLWEGLPYALLEAMAAGKTVIASRVGGMADVLQDGVNGILVPPRDPAALAEAMTKALENEPQRSKIGGYARETVTSRYRIEKMIDRLGAVYEGRL